MSQVSLRARITIDDPSKIGKYTCMAQDAAGNTGSAILTMQEGISYQPTYPPTYPGLVPRRKFKNKKKEIFILVSLYFLASGGDRGYLRIIAPDMAEGDYVEIQCEGAAPEDEGRIQWFFNNRVCIYFLSI